VLDPPASNTDGFIWRGTCVSTTQLDGPIWNKVSLYHPWKTYDAGTFHFKNLLNSHREAMCKMLLLLTPMVFFREIHVFFELSWKGLFGRKIACLHLQNPKLQEVLHSKTNSVLTGKQCARCSCFYHRWCSFERQMCVFNSAEWAYLEQSDLISTLKNVSCMKYSFQKLTEFSKGINVLDDPASNVIGFL
jgi:hypothetical protein